MEKQEKEQARTTIIIGPEKRRYSDCCNAEILNNRCPKCGRYLEQAEGKREVVIKGLDGRSPGIKSRTQTIPVSMIDDKPKQEDKMPAYFKELQSRSGVNITSWTDSSI